MSESNVAGPSLSDPSDNGLAEYNIYELAERQADYLQNRQVREREEREALLALRAEKAEAAQEPETEQESESDGS